MVIWHGSRDLQKKEEIFGKILSHKLLRKKSPKSKHYEYGVHLQNHYHTA